MHSITEIQQYAKDRAFMMTCVMTSLTEASTLGVHVGLTQEQFARMAGNCFAKLKEGLIGMEVDLMEDILKHEGIQVVSDAEAAEMNPAAEIKLEETVQPRAACGHDMCYKQDPVGKCIYRERENCGCDPEDPSPYCTHQPPK